MSKADLKKYKSDVRKWNRFYGSANEPEHNPWHGPDGKFTTKDKAIKQKGSYSLAGVRRKTTAKNLPFADKQCGRVNRPAGPSGPKYGLRCKDNKIPSWAKQVSAIARRSR